MQRRVKVTIAGVAVAAAALAIGGGIAAAGGTSGDDAEAPLAGADLEQASAAALAHTGGGRVTNTEVGDEESLYEVEVTLDDGRQVDVQLDAGFAVVGASADVEGDEGDEGADD